MKAYVVLDGLFTYKDGKPASNNMDYAFFVRYLSVYTEVTVVARCFPVEDGTAAYVEGDRVAFYKFPAYRGPTQLLRVLPKFVNSIFSVALKDGIFFLRMPATIPLLVGIIRYIFRKPFAIELVGDPHDAYSHDSLRTGFSGIYQAIFTRITRFLCAKSVATSYVTKHSLQEKYPAAHEYSYTSLALPSSAISLEPRVFSERACHNIVMVAMMQNFYKGHDLAIKALSLLKKEWGDDFKITFVGDGPLKESLQEMARDHGIEENSLFVGKKSSGADVFQVMDSADLMILPSRQEGLPRVVIEAMARGLPCLCSDVGGTAELVDDVQLLPRDFSIETFAERLRIILSDSKLKTELSKRNLERAKEYEADVVQIKRESFYQFLVNNYR